jgi:hypothetical protein
MSETNLNFIFVREWIVLSEICEGLKWVFTIFFWLFLFYLWYLSIWVLYSWWGSTVVCMCLVASFNPQQPKKPRPNALFYREIRSYDFQLHLDVCLLFFSCLLSFCYCIISTVQYTYKVWHTWVFNHTTLLSWVLEGKGGEDLFSFSKL